MSTTNKISIGHLNEVEALSFFRFLVLVGKGENTTTGWKNWFEPERAPNHYAFMQEAPSGIVAQVMLPFTVIGFFPLNNARSVFVHELMEGKLTEVEVPVRRASILEADALKKFAKSPEFFREELMLEAGAHAAADVPAYRKHLGSVDIPLLCATWTHPLRARRFDLYLDIRVGEAQDIERAVVECLKQSAVAAALITLLTPVGWATGTAIFQSLLEACLIPKLRKVIACNLDIESNCV